MQGLEIDRKKAPDDESRKRVDNPWIHFCFDESGFGRAGTRRPARMLKKVGILVDRRRFP
jgi:hypothetical protein